MDAGLLDLILLVHQCGGQIARASYGGTDYLVRTGYLVPSGIDHLGRQMVSLTEKGREVLQPEPAKAQGEEAAHSQPSMFQGVQGVTSPPVTLSFQLPKGTPLTGGVFSYPFYGSVVGSSAAAGQVGVEVHGVTWSTRFDVFLRCYSWQTTASVWDHRQLALCSSCGGKFVHDAGLIPVGILTGVGCPDCGYTGRQWNASTTFVIKVV